MSPSSAYSERDAREARPDPLDVLILDGDCRQALACARAFGRAGRTVAVAASRSAMPAVAFASRWPSLRAVLPDTDRPHEYVDALVRLLQQHPARVVIPNLDGTVSAITGDRSRIEATGAVLSLGSERAVDDANDKRRTLEAAHRAGIPIPRGLQIDEPSQIQEAEELVGFPAVVKPARSWSEERNNWTANVSVVESSAGLRAATLALLSSGDRPIVQQYLTGRREALHVLRVAGAIRAMVAVSAVRTYPPLGGRAVLRETIPLPADSAEFADRLLGELGLDGYSEVEFRRDSEGQPFLMEINPRLSGSVEAAIRAGVDLPNMIFDWATGKEVESTTSYRPGVRLRWLEGDARWIGYTVRRQGEPDVLPRGRALAAFARDFVRPTGYDFFDAHDPAPVLVAMRGTVAKARKWASGRSPWVRS